MKNLKSYLLVFSVAFILRLVWIFITGSHVHPQEWEYEVVATNLLNGKGFIYTHLNTVYFSIVQPLYPFFCAVIYFVSRHSFLILELIQAAIASITCVTVFNIAEIIFSNRKVAIISAMLLTFHPGIIAYTAKLHPLVLDSFFISLVALSFLRLSSNFSTRNQIFAGLMSGLCILTRSTIVLFLPIMVAWFFYKSPYIKKKIIFGFGLILLVSSIIILPWIIRNYMVYKQFVFIQTTTGEVFWRGNNINATGSAYRINGKTVLESSSPEFLKKLYSLDEMGQNKLFREEAFNFIKDHPFKSVSLFIKKNYYFWWFSPQSGMEYPKLYLLIYKALYSVVILFGILGIIFALSSKISNIRESTLLILLLFLSISFAQSLFYVEGRHRWAIEPLMLIFTANGIINIKNMVKR